MTIDFANSYDGFMRHINFAFFGVRFKHNTRLPEGIDYDGIGCTEEYMNEALSKALKDQEWHFKVNKTIKRILDNSDSIKIDGDVEDVINKVLDFASDPTKLFICICSIRIFHKIYDDIRFKNVEMVQYPYVVGDSATIGYSNELDYKKWKSFIL